jgi:MarR family 2-MHQ and catechol resistance regulon transcriptional repressor
MWSEVSYPNPKEKLWVFWIRTSDAISRYRNSSCQKAGLSYQHSAILKLLERVGRPMTITEVAKGTTRNVNSISTIANRMEKLGLINKVTYENDKRTVYLVLTRKGMEKILKADEVITKLIEGIFSDFSEEELLTMESIIEKTYDSMSKFLYKK